MRMFVVVRIENSSDNHVPGVLQCFRQRLRGEVQTDSQYGAKLCRREGIAPSLSYKWSKEFLEAGNKQLSGETERQAVWWLRLGIAIERIKPGKPTQNGRH